MKTSSVTATEANRSFSKLLRDVQRGERVEITSHGRTVAVLEPVMDKEMPTLEQRMAALAVLKKRWAEQEFVVVGPWTRDELYERD